MKRRDLASASLALLGSPLLARHALAQGGTSGGTSGAAPGEGKPLVIAIGGAINSIDPHFFSATPNHTVANHIFSRLMERDRQGNPIPGLALSWAPVSETEWEFKLRPGVKWHDGRDFTADDAIFTFARARDVPNSPGGLGPYLSSIAEAKAPDPLTLRVTTKGPAPLLPRQLLQIHIVSRHVGEGATTDQYNSGKAAVGTGPYKFVRYVPGDRLEMVRNEEYWGQKPEWTQVTLRQITNPGARVAALLSGDVGIIDTPPAGDLPRLRSSPQVTVETAPGLRLIYLGPDFSHATNPPEVTTKDGKPFDKSPLLDLRVRRALNIAINRQALAERVMQGMATPTGQWMPQGSFGYAPEVKVPPYAPDEARKLLTEAGFPEGFRITLRTPNDRYPNDSETAQAVAQMWTRIGVQTRIEAMPWSAYVPRATRQEYSMCLWGWSSSTGEGSNVMNSVLSTYNKEKGRGSSNDGRYSNPELDALTDAALSTIDDAKREALIQKGVAMAMGDVSLIPLFILTNAWATRKGLTYAAGSSEMTLAMDVHSA